MDERVERLALRLARGFGLGLLAGPALALTTGFVLARAALPDPAGVAVVLRLWLDLDRLAVGS
jgi:hypothetical protein